MIRNRRDAVAAPGRAPSESAMDRFVEVWSWPLLMALCLSATALAFASEWPLLWFNVVYFGLAATLLVLERRWPHSSRWRRGDGQTFANLAHTVLNKGLVQVLVLFAAAIGLSALAPPLSEGGARGVWPREWPMFAQVVLALLVVEFGLYWVHRFGHEWPLLWRFHAVHHSVERLWIVNTGRFHFVDSLLSVIVGMAIPVLLGAPLEVLIWISAITAYVGILTHCNVRMRNRALSRWLNTPGLHRWHHSRDPAEGNGNYGENLMLWDRLFGTWHHPERPPPENIGIDEPMPAAFLAQLAHPFRPRRSTPGR